jgi:hypothetical protein
MWSKTKS